MSARAASITGDLTMSVLESLGGGDRSNYLALIDAAFVANEPVYSTQWFGDLFRKRARDASWVASLLASDSYMEGYSAKRLWQYSGSLEDQALARSMQRHAADERKHSRIFATAVFKTFPSLETPELAQSLGSNAPSLVRQDLEVGHLLPPPSEEELLNSMLLINLFEVKALVLGMLIKPVVLAHAPSENRASLDKLLTSVVEDEARHIAYSADFIETACGKGHRKTVESSLREFQATLNELTVDELGRDVH